MKEIILTQGQKALVDDADYDGVISGRKYIAVRYPRENCLLAARTQWNQEKKQVDIIYLGRELLGLTNADPRQVKYLNGNSLDNQRINLQIVETT